jgi:hypothetical protein
LSDSQHTLNVMLGDGLTQLAVKGKLVRGMILKVSEVARRTLVGKR